MVGMNDVEFKMWMKMACPKLSLGNVYRAPQGWQSRLIYKGKSIQTNTSTIRYYPYSGFSSAEVMPYAIEKEKNSLLYVQIFGTGEATSFNLVEPCRGYSDKIISTYTNLDRFAHDLEKVIEFTEAFRKMTPQLLADNLNQTFPHVNFVVRQGRNAVECENPSSSFSLFGVQILPVLYKNGYHFRTFGWKDIRYPGYRVFDDTKALFARAMAVLSNS